eukprot:1863887-Prymnesium_polylepis.1
MDATAVRAASSQPMPTPFTVTHSRARRQGPCRWSGRAGSIRARWTRRAPCPGTWGAAGA